MSNSHNRNCNLIPDNVAVSVWRCGPLLNAEVINRVKKLWTFGQGMKLSKSPHSEASMIQGKDDLQRVYNCEYMLYYSGDQAIFQLASCSRMNAGWLDQKRTMPYIEVHIHLFYI